MTFAARFGVISVLFAAAGCHGNIGTIEQVFPDAQEGDVLQDGGVDIDNPSPNSLLRDNQQSDPPALVPPCALIGSGGIQFVALSPNGRQIAIGERSGTIEVFATDNGLLLKRWATLRLLAGLSWIDDESIVDFELGVSTREFVRYHATSGEVLSRRVFDSGQYDVFSSLAPDKHHALLTTWGGEESVDLLHPERQLTVDSGLAFYVEQGRALTTKQLGKIQTFDTDTGLLKRERDAPEAGLLTDVSADNALGLFSNNSEKTVSVVDLDEAAVAWDKSTSAPTFATFSPGSKYVLFESLVTEGHAWTLSRASDGSDSVDLGIRTLLIAPVWSADDNALIFISEDSSGLDKFETATHLWSHVSFSSGPSVDVEDAVVSVNGMHLATQTLHWPFDNRATYRIWDTATMTKAATYAGPVGALRAVSDDGTTIQIDDQSVNLPTGTATKTTAFTELCYAKSPTAAQYVYTDTANLVVRDLGSDQVLATFQNPFHAVASLAVGPMGTPVLVEGYRGANLVSEIDLVDPRTGVVSWQRVGVVESQPLHKSAPAIFSQHGDHAFFADSLIDIATGKDMAMVKRLDQFRHPIAFVKNDTTILEINGSFFPGQTVLHLTEVSGSKHTVLFDNIQTNSQPFFNAATGKAYAVTDGVVRVYCGLQ